MVVERGREIREQGGIMSIRKHKSVVFRTMRVDMNAAKTITKSCVCESDHYFVCSMGLWSCQDSNRGGTDKDLFLP